MGPMSNFITSSSRYFDRKIKFNPLFLPTLFVPSHKPDPFSSNPTRTHILSVATAAAAGALLSFSALPIYASCDSQDGAYQHHRSIGGKDSTDILVRGVHKKVPEEFIHELRAICGSNMSLDYDERHFHGKPQNSFHKAVNVPDVVVFPRSQGDVQKIVSSCNKFKIPIVPYGGATSIEGHTLAPNGGVCIDMSQMNKVKALHVEDMDVVVEPGIGWIELNEYLKPHGFFFPLDPGPGASIGGMCATRCSGSLAVRYGTMRDNVINLHVVLSTGDVIKTASRARKSSAGYDLTRLMIGSEGTLGIITEVTLRLQKLPQYSVVAMCHFESVKDAGNVAMATMHSGINFRYFPLYPRLIVAITCCNSTATDMLSALIAQLHYSITKVSRMELLDEVQIRAINIANEKRLPEKTTLMFEFVGTEASSREQALLIQKIVSEHNGTDFIYVEDSKAKEELWKIRKEALWSCFALAPNFDAMITDVCVPLSHLADCISRTKEELDASYLLCTVISHAGDGNIHTIILFDPNNEEHRKEAERLNHLMVKIALSMDGTCTGEHGVGTGKLKYLEEEHGIEALRAMKRIKNALDPNNIMNPGKLIPPHVCL